VGKVKIYVHGGYNLNTYEGEITDMVMGHGIAEFKVDGKDVAIMNAIVVYEENE
jgi:hypothetical protein